MAASRSGVIGDAAGSSAGSGTTAAACDRPNNDFLTFGAGAVSSDDSGTAASFGALRPRRRLLRARAGGVSTSADADASGSRAGAGWGAVGTSAAAGAKPDTRLLAGASSFGAFGVFVVASASPFARTATPLVEPPRTIRTRPAINR